MKQLLKLLEPLLPILPWAAVVMLVIACIVVLFFIGFKFLNTWQLFYSKQDLFNELLASINDGEESDDEGHGEKDATLTDQNIESANELPMEKSNPETANKL